MNAVPLEAGDYQGTYKLIGGEACLDFVNTVSWPGSEREHDWLDRAANFTAWAMAAGFIGRRARARLDALPLAKRNNGLRQVHRTRSMLRGVLGSLANGRNPAPAAIEDLNAHLQRVSALRRIDPSSRQWIWAEPESFTEVLAPVIWNSAHVLTEVDPDRLGRCAACDWLFYDTTRNRSRRWCAMEDCGSRDKALRYYHRAKTGE